MPKITSCSRGFQKSIEAYNHRFQDSSEAYNHRFQDSSEAYTLIEMLVVIAIIAVLAVISITIYSGVQGRARDAVRMSDLREMANALEQFYLDNNYYPTGCNWSTDVCWATFIPSVLMVSVPVDPLNTNLGNCDNVGDPTQAGCHVYHYCSPGAGANFLLGVNMERTSFTTSFPNCPLAGDNLFYVRSQNGW